MNPLPPTDPDIFFEPAEPDFFERNKSKILAATGGVLVLILIAAVSQILWQNRTNSLRASYAAATTPEQLASLAKGGGTIAGNAELQLAAQLRDQKKFDEALKGLDGFEDKFAKHPLLPNAALLRGSVLEAKGDLAAAAEAYAKAAVSHESSYAAPYALLMQGRLLRLADKPDEARRVFENAITRYPGTPAIQEVIQEMNLLPEAPKPAASPSTTPAAEISPVPAN